MRHDADNPFRPIVTHWLAAIRAGDEVKQARFGKDAAEGMRFFTGTCDFFWNKLANDRHFRRAGDSTDLDSSEPLIKVQCNKTAELYEIFGPTLYNRNPVRTVTPRQQPALPPELYATIPGQLGGSLLQQMSGKQQAEQIRDNARASLLSAYLNWSPNATNLRTHGRKTVGEAIIKGMGILLTEPCRPSEGGFNLVGSFHRSVDDFIIDPDATSLDDAKWIALRCVHPVWEVEKSRGLPPGTLANRGSYESHSQAVATTVSQEGGITYWNHRDGRTNDLLVYWKIWSKMGVGGRLKGVSPDLRGVLDLFGTYCYVEVADGVPWLLNAPDTLPVQDAINKCQWPTPYWADGGWPITPIYFHDVPGEVWPLSHLAPAMGELKFLNWAYGHVASKIRTTSRDFIAVLKSAGLEIKDRILNGSDLELLEISETAGKTINEVVQFLQHPSFNGDIWKVIEAVSEQFDKRTGLTELMYGQTGAVFRSGTEARVKADQLNVRPDDMADSVEAAMSLSARREALCARWHLEPSDVSRVLGEVGSLWWEQLVYAADPRDIIFDFEYRVESGSTRKPNKTTESEQATAMMNNLFSPFYQYAGTTGDMVPVNSMIEFWCKANDIKDVDKFQFKAVPAQPQQQALPPATEQNQTGVEA